MVSIPAYNGIGEAADEAVLNKVMKKYKNPPLKGPKLEIFVSEFFTQISILWA
jgi:hypothetical protein